MTIAWWQILLLTCLAFWVIIDQLTVSILNNPLAIGMVSGIIMGDITTGLAVESTLQLMVLGVSTYDGASMPDFMTGATRCACSIHQHHFPTQNGQVY
jgi:PTS system mannose-specific IIC component